MQPGICCLKQNCSRIDLQLAIQQPIQTKYHSEQQKHQKEPKTEIIKNKRFWWRNGQTAEEMRPKGDEKYQFQSVQNLFEKSHRIEDIQSENRKDFSTTQCQLWQRIVLSMDR